VPISNVGFSGLISSVYPAFGYVGMFMLFMILIQGLNMLVSKLAASFAFVSSKREYKNRDR